jgi:transposase
MGRSKSSKWTTDERTAAVLAVLRGEESHAATARRYQVSEKTLTTWRNEFLAAGRAAMAGGKKGQQAELDALKNELAERDRVIGEITVANRYLQKKLVG